MNNFNLTAKIKNSHRYSNKEAETVSSAAKAFCDEVPETREKSKKSSDTNPVDPNATTENPESFKLLTDLNTDEAKKECLKLGLIEAGSKVKTDFCLIKISEFLGSRGLKMA